MTQPHMGIVAEAGAESIIPLSPSKRTRGIDLWRETGELLGVRPYADGGVVGRIKADDEDMPVATGNNSGGVTIKIDVNANPEFTIGTGSAGDDEQILAVLKAHIRSMADVARAQNEAAILKMRKDHAELASQMIKKAAKRLLLIPEEELSAADIVRMFDIGVKIERLSRGAPTENRQITGEITAAHTGTVDFQFTDDLDFSCLTDGELKDFELMLEKIYRPRD